MTDKIIYTPSEVMELMEKEPVVLIDIRDAEDYAEQHIAGAVSVTQVFFYLAMTDPEGLEALHKEFKEHFSAIGLTPDKTAIIYEDSYDSRYGGSCRGYWLLRYLGHEKVGVLDGGFSAWVEEGLPVNSDAVESERSDFQVNPRPDILATRDDMVKALEDSSVKLLDNRDAIEWVGKSSSPYGIDYAPRKGRIPGATWIEWYEFMERDGQIPYFKSNEKIRALCAEKGFQPDDDIIIYCFKGARAANTFVALKEAGFKNVRNYLGSWNEWSRDDTLPADESVIS